MQKSNKKLKSVEKTPIGKFKIDQDENDNYDINQKSGKTFYSNLKSMKKNLTSNKKIYNNDSFNDNSHIKKINEDHNTINKLNFETEQQIVDVNHFSNKSYKDFIFETPINNNINQNEDFEINNKNEISNFQNVEISEFFSRYNTLEKGSKLLSYKRKREQLIKESYQAFGFSFDSGINLKKGFSKVEKEKLLAKQKRESLTENEINTNNDIQINSLDKDAGDLFGKHYEKINNSSNSFMQDAIVKKCRIEIEKEKFLEEQKKLKDSKDCKKNENDNKDENMNSKNSIYLSFKEKKQALLNSINNGILN